MQGAVDAVKEKRRDEFRRFIRQAPSAPMRPQRLRQSFDDGRIELSAERHRFGVSRSVDERRRAIGIWAGVGGFALASGPMVGGWLVEAYSWRSIFWLNVPVGLFAAPALGWLLPEVKLKGMRKLDGPGQTLIIAGAAAITFGLIEGNGLGWTTPLIILAFLVGVTAFVAFIIHELRTGDPMLPLTLFRSRILTVACVVNFFNFFALFAVLFTMTFYWQGAGRLSPFDTGLRFLTLTVPIMIASYLASTLGALVVAFAMPNDRPRIVKVPG